MYTMLLRIFRKLCVIFAFYRVITASVALEVFLNGMRHINPRFTYLLTLLGGVA